MGGGNWGDGKLASETLLLDPVALAVDRDENLFAVDGQGDRVVRVDGRTGLVAAVVS